MLLQGQHHQAILGDLNTMAHGIARLSPNYCCDKMRFWSIGQQEAVFWHHNVFGQMAASDGKDGSHDEERQTLNQQLRRWGLPEDVCMDILNPGRPVVPLVYAKQ